jgi:hypothetical protein
MLTESENAEIRAQLVHTIASDLAARDLPREAWQAALLQAMLAATEKVIAERPGVSIQEMRRIFTADQGDGSLADEIRAEYSRLMCPSGGMSSAQFRQELAAQLLLVLHGTLPEERNATLNTLLAEARQAVGAAHPGAPDGAIATMFAGLESEVMNLLAQAGAGGRA